MCIMEGEAKEGAKINKKWLSFFILGLKIFYNKDKLGSFLFVIKPLFLKE